MIKKLPNILSGSRILLAIVFLALFFAKPHKIVFLSFFFDPATHLKILAIGIFIIAAITDFFDGYIARKYSASSKYGIFLDPLADKFLTFSGFIALPLIFPNLFPWWAIILIVIRDIVTTVLRIYADKKGEIMQTSVLAKWKTALQMIFLYLALLSLVLYKIPPSSPIGVIGDVFRWLLSTRSLTVSLYFITALTVYSGIEYLLQNRHLFKK